MSIRTLGPDLAAIVGPEAVLLDPPVHFLEDATSSRASSGLACVSTPMDESTIEEIGRCFEQVAA